MSVSVFFFLGCTPHNNAIWHFHRRWTQKWLKIQFFCYFIFSNVWCIDFKWAIYSSSVLCSALLFFFYMPPRFCCNFFCTAIAEGIQCFINIVAHAILSLFSRLSILRDRARHIVSWNAIETRDKVYMRKPIHCVLSNVRRPRRANGVLHGWLLCLYSIGRFWCLSHSRWTDK